MIETLHLGVEGGVGERRTEPSPTGGAVAHHHDHENHHGHDHSNHSHGAVAETQSATLQVEHEGVDVPSVKPAGARKSVGFAEDDDNAGEGVDHGVPAKKGRKQVAFVRHDKPELYDF